MKSKLSALFSCLLWAWVLPGFTQEPPNIILILADDQGYGDTDVFWPDSAIRTPNLARLAKKGIMLTNFRVQPLCTPTRAALMTGLFNAGFNQKGSAHEHGVDDRLTFFTEYLRRAGYQTGGFGKWHLDSRDGNHPLDRGFQHWIGFYGGDMPYHSSSAKGRVFEGKTPYRKRWNHTTDLFADEAIRFISANRSRPFFVYLAFNAVHTPLWSINRPVFSARSDWVRRIQSRGISEPSKIDYYGLVEHMDERVGSVLDAVNSMGLEQNTLIIYLSDNGAITPDHFYNFPQQGNNGPFRGGKASPYEGGIRVPFVASWPGVIPENSVSDQASMDADILPTLLGAAGMRIPAANGPRDLDGRSLLALLKSPAETTLPDRGTPSWLGCCFAYVNYPWKLVSVDKRVGLESGRGTEPTDGRLLFNLDSDPGESTDLTQLHEQRAKDLWEQYQELYHSIRTPLHP
jgi:arylsulfatase A-like enzyme